MCSEASLTRRVSAPTRRGSEGSTRVQAPAGASACSHGWSSAVPARRDPLRNPWKRFLLGWFSPRMGRRRSPARGDYSSAPFGAGLQTNNLFHGFRSARLTPGSASPVATIRGPAGAEKRCSQKNSQFPNVRITKSAAFLHLFTSLGNTPKALNNKAKGRERSERTLGWQSPQRY
jgi:hypothetical protein